MHRYLLGYDVGSSSVKATLLDIESGLPAASAVSPEREMPIRAPRPGWAEQDPEDWWEHMRRATARLGPPARLSEVTAVGISYQMHGLVCLDRSGAVLRPAIIWCDSRAVDIGARAFAALGEDLCLRRLLNAPGNFTASKLAWVRANEPRLFERIDKALLPGDYLAYRMTGEARTTASGLSEGIFWDFQRGSLAGFLLEHYGIPEAMIAPLAPTFAPQGELTREAAAALGLRAGTPLCYRAGDQPNNAFSLNVLEPAEVAATAGTSGVVYSVGSQAAYDPQSRVNTFVHVNHAGDRARYGTLMCVNGAAILNSWLRRNTVSLGADSLSYDQMNALAEQAPPGCEGLRLLPYGNGAERTLGNRSPGAALVGLDLNRHGRSHLLRAAQEGIVFALRYGMQIMTGMGLATHRVRAGAANMFLSPLFAEAFAAVTGAPLELYSTDGSQGAARGAGIGAGLYDWRSAFRGLKATRVVEPGRALVELYAQAYEAWRAELERALR